MEETDLKWRGRAVQPSESMVSTPHPSSVSTRALTAWPSFHSIRYTINLFSSSPSMALPSSHGAIPPEDKKLVTDGDNSHNANDASKDGEGESSHNANDAVKDGDSRNADVAFKDDAGKDDVICL
ncbi:hypothetical protein L484_014342 [Morus notabilis]|uniref:Uncharacterized protein n=1 Tax=Morus notabilis TaxID=981085 RepID=W9RKV1_9ROSA|nr:hypothetical protein L484_014342 [Morus notabilis]